VDRSNPDPIREGYSAVAAIKSSVTRSNRFNDSVRWVNRLVVTVQASSRVLISRV